MVKSGFTNPPYSIESSENLEIYDKDNSLIAKEIISFQYVPGILNAKITSTSDLAGEISTFTFKFDLTNPILRGGYIMIDFPYFNQNSGALAHELLSCISDSNVQLINKQVRIFS